MNQQELNSVDSLQILMNDWIPQQTTQQNGDKAPSETKNVEFRLCLKNVPKNFTKMEIQDLYHVKSEKIHFPKSNTDNDVKQHGIRMVFVQFSSRSDAESAKKQINSNKTSNIHASFAEKPKQKQSHSQQSSSSHQQYAANSTVSCQSTSISEQTEPSKTKEEIIGSCERCGLNAKHVCDVCGSFYCSSACQRKDWLTHKLICKPMPKLVIASKKFASTSESNDDEDSASDSENATVNVGTKTTESSSGMQKVKFIVPFVECTIVRNATVVITAICSINRLYVRLVGGDYSKVIAEIAAFVSKAKKQEMFPEVDDVVLAPFDGIFYRAQVLSINTPDSNGNDLIVLFIDYGNMSKVSSKNLKKLDYKHRSLKRHAFNVILNDVSSRIVNEASMQYLNDLLINKDKLLVDDVASNPNNRFITLLKLSTGENVNQTIVKLSVVEEVSDIEEVVMCDDVKPLPLSIGSDISLFVTDCRHLKEGFIGCMPLDAVPELLQTEKTIEEYGFRTKDMKYSPIKNELCLIQVDKHWYRAAVVEKSSKSGEFHFYLIDWCRLESNVSNENIRKMPKQFGNPRPKAHLCRILDRSSIKAQNIEKQVKVNSTFTVTSIVLNDENQYCLKF